MAGGKIDILVEPDMRGFNGKLDAGLKGAVGLAAKAGVGLAAALGTGALVREVTQIGVEFQSQMNTMAAVSQATASQLDQVRQRARELGNDTSLTATSASDAAAAMTELAKGGFSVEQAMTAARGTLQLAAAAQVDAATAATIQAQSLQAFSLDATHAARVSDILAGSANASSAEMTDVAQALQQAGTVANQFGISIDDTATAIAQFANAGITGSDAGTLLKTVLLSLTDQGKPAQRAIKELGLTIYDEQGKFVGLAELMGQLNAAAARMTDEQYQAATATLFGSDAMRLAGIAASQGTEDFEKLRDAVTRQGQAAEVAAAQTQGLPGALERLQNTKEEVLLGIFDALQGDLVKAADAATKALEAIGPAAASSIGAASSTIRTLAGVIGPVVSGVGELNDAMGGLLGTATAVGAVMVGAKWLGVPTALAPFVEGVRGLSDEIRLQKTLAGHAGTSISTLSAGYGALARQSTTLQAMTSAYKQQAGHLSMVAARHREAALAAQAHALAAKNVYTFTDRAVAQAGHTAVATTAKATGAIAGTASAAATGIKTVASGAVSLLGGPIGLAITGATLLTVGLVDAYKKMDAAVEAFGSRSQIVADHYSSVSTALIEGTSTTDAATKSFEQMHEANKTAGDGLNWLGRAALAANDYLGYLPPGLTAAGEAIRDQVDTAAEAADLLGKINIENADLAKAATGSFSEYVNLRERILTGGELNDDARGAQLLVDQLEQIRNETEAARNVFDQLGPAGANAAHAIDEIAQRAGSAVDRTVELRQAFMELAGIEMDATQASANLTRELGQVEQNLEGISGATLDSSGAIDVTTQSGVKLYEQLNSMGDAMTKAAAAGEPVEEVFSRSQGSLEMLRQQLQLAPDEWQALLDKMQLTPEKLNVLVEINSDAAKAEVAQVGAALKQVDGETWTAKVVVKDLQAREYLEEVGAQVKVLDEKTGLVEVKVDDDEAKAKLDSLINEGFPGFEQASPTATVHLDTEELEGSSAKAQELLNILDIQEPSPEAKLIIDQLQAGKDISMAELAKLAQETSTPTADLDKKLFDAGILNSRDELTRFGNAKAVAKADIDTTQADTKIDSLWGRLKGLFGYLATGTPPGGPSTSSGSASGGGAVSGPGRAGRFATGGRLPRSGPGTDRVDGFLGIDSYGMPLARVDAGEWIINRRASERFNHTLNALNKGDAATAVAHLLQQLPGHAKGGRTAKVKRDLAPLDGTPYIMGGWSLRGTDCSGAVSAAVNSWVNLPIFHSRMSTVTQGAWLKAKGAISGRGSLGDFNIGWWDRGGGANGHTSMQLPDGTFVESGGNSGGGLTIGRTAGRLDGRGYTHWAHFPGEMDKLNISLTGGLGSLMLGGEKLSADGVSNTRSVNWGDAQRLHELALKFMNAKVYDTGGLLPTGGLAVNLGRPERILSAAQTDAFAEFTKLLPELNRTLREFNQTMDKEFFTASDTLAAFGPIANSQIVLDAERGLKETREAIADEISEIKEAEEDLAEARKALSKSERDSADKLKDAQDKLRKAKNSKDDKDKADRIAKAERDLAKVREDLPDKVKSSSDKIEKASEKLAAAQEKQADAAKRLEAAERTLVAARLQALVDLVQSFANTMANAAGKISEFFGAIAAVAEYVQQLRQGVSALRQQQIRDSLNQQRAIIDLHVAEWDLTRTRRQGAISVAEAEKKLEETRKAQALLGATGIEAMRGALDRFRVTGKFAIDEVAESVLANNRAVKEAEWVVAEARSQALINELEATHKQELAALSLAEATLQQAQTVEMLRLKTAELTDHAQHLYGLSPNQARGAQAGFSGIGKIFGGLGKTVGLAATGFAAGGPIGALIGGVAGLATGLGDVVKGFVDIKANRSEIKDAWRGMNLLDKAAIVFGSVGAGALNAAGGLATAQFGPQVGALLDGAGDNWAAATIGSRSYELEANLAAAKRRYEDKVNAFELQATATKLELELRRQALVNEHTLALEAAKATHDQNTLNRQLATATTEKEIKALNEAAAVAAQKREAMIAFAARTEQVQRESMGHLRAILEETRRAAQQRGVQRLEVKIDLPAGRETFTREEMATALRQATTAVSGVDFVNARI